MNTLKLISLFVSNIGGTFAIINMICVLYNSRLNLSCKLTDVFHACKEDERAPVFIKLSLINNSRKTVAFHELYLSYCQSKKQSQCFHTSRNKVFITKKEYKINENSGFSYPLFTTELPVSIPPKGCTVLLLEVFGNPKVDQLNYVTIDTANKKRVVKLSTESLKEVNQYQFR